MHSIDVGWEEPRDGGDEIYQYRPNLLTLTLPLPLPIPLPLPLPLPLRLLPKFPVSPAFDHPGPAD